MATDSPETRPSGAPPPPARCRDCGGALGPTDAPDVHNGALACVKALQHRVRVLEDGATWQNRQVREFREVARLAQERVAELEAELADRLVDSGGTK